jgi:type II secretory pathway pseudopilin PulG
LVVIAIIGILASVVMVSATGIRQKGRDTKRISDLSTVASALQSYYADFHVYPTSAGWNTSTTTFATALNLLITNHYLVNIPTDPRSPTYYYRYYGACAGHTSYVLWTTLENMNDNPVNKATTNFTLRNGEGDTSTACP